MKDFERGKVGFLNYAKPKLKELSVFLGDRPYFAGNHVSSSSCSLWITLRMSDCYRRLPTSTFWSTNCWMSSSLWSPPSWTTFPTWKLITTGSPGCPLSLPISNRSDFWGLPSMGPWLHGEEQPDGIRVSSKVFPDFHNTFCCFVVIEGDAESRRHTPEPLHIKVQ